MYSINQVITQSHLFCLLALFFSLSCCSYPAALLISPPSFFILFLHFCIAPIPIPSFSPLSHQFLFPLLISLISSSTFSVSHSSSLLCLSLARSLTLRASKFCQQWRYLSVIPDTHRGMLGEKSPTEAPSLESQGWTSFCVHTQLGESPHQKEIEKRGWQRKRNRAGDEEKLSRRVNCVCEDSRVHRQQDAGGETIKYLWHRNKKCKKDREGRR